MGQIQNINGEPLPNIDVSATTLTDDYFQGNQQDGYLLGRNKSNPDGTVRVTCLLDVNSDFFIKVNGNDEYIDYSYVFNTDLSEPEDLVINIGTVTLQKRANVTLNIIRLNQMDMPIEYSISYQLPRCAEVYEDSLLILDQSSCFDTTSFNRSIDGDSNQFQEDFVSLLGSIVTITYSINNQPQMIESFTINQSDFTYEFNY